VRIVYTCIKAGELVRETKRWFRWRGGTILSIFSGRRSFFPHLGSSGPESLFSHISLASSGRSFLVCSPFWSHFPTFIHSGAQKRNLDTFTCASYSTYLGWAGVGPSWTDSHLAFVGGGGGVGARNTAGRRRRQHRFYVLSRSFFVLLYTSHTSIAYAHAYTPYSEDGVSIFLSALQCVFGF